MIGQYAAWFTSPLILYLFYERAWIDKINYKVRSSGYIYKTGVANNDCFKFCCMNVNYQYCLPLILVTFLFFPGGLVYLLQDVLPKHFWKMVNKTRHYIMVLQTTAFSGYFFKPSNYCFTFLITEKPVTAAQQPFYNIKIFQLSEN